MKKKRKPNYNDKILNEKTFSAIEVGKEIVASFRRGVKAAAEVADNYNSSTTHPYMLGDCIRAKLNQLDHPVRKNANRLTVSKK